MEIELSSPKLKNLIKYQERTLKSQAKIFFYFLRGSKNKFMHSSS